MACSVTQADLGPLFADVDADLATAIIAQATLIVLGPAAGQAVVESQIEGCGVDPCGQIVLLAQHLLSTASGSGAGGGGEVTSEKVDDVTVTYSTAGGSSGLWAGSPFGSMYAYNLAVLEKCRARRRSLPRAIGTTGATHS